MVYIEKVKIQNYKCFENIEIELNRNLNIIVGNNEEGKSTILEAIHLAVSGMINGRYVMNEMTLELFNQNAVSSYLESLKTEHILPLPEILIEIYLQGEDIAILEGDMNSDKKGCSGVSFRICFDKQLQSEYESFIAQKEINSLPVEYFKIERYSFARDAVTNRSIPLKSVIIDSSSNKFQNGSDVYISKIIKDDLDEKEITAITQCYRELKEKFSSAQPIIDINKKITDKADISNKNVSISMDMSAKNTWETTLMTFIDNIPFPQIGKGEQCMIKTNLALAHQKAQTSNLILLEEPENHLSYSNLNVLLNKIQKKCSDKQLIVTTHSNFVANKLNLSNLIILSNKQNARLDSLSQDDADYFKKLPGYDTLRMILSKRTILVEGPSDELIVQRAFIDKNQALPIEKGIDIISVRGLAFKRFLNIARIAKKKVAVVTDNDGNYHQKIEEKYGDYKNVDNIKIFASDINELNTLEPQFVDANKEHLSELRNALSLSKDKYSNLEDIICYMTSNKSEWALKIFDSDYVFEYPTYITNAIEWVYGRE